MRNKFGQQESAIQYGGLYFRTVQPLSKDFCNRLASARRNTGTMPFAMFRQGKPYQVSPGDSLYDLFLYTPATYLNGTPPWLAANGSKSAYGTTAYVSSVFSPSLL